MLDQHNYHFFPPLLYEVSTAFIEPSNIIYPFRKLFQKASNIRFHMGKLDKVLPEFNKLVTDQVHSHMITWYLLWEQNLIILEMKT